MLTRAASFLARRSAPLVAVAAWLAAGAIRGSFGPSGSVESGLPLLTGVHRLSPLAGFSEPEQDLSADRLHERASRVAARREISLAELVRRGLEYMVAVSAPEPGEGEWSLPEGRPLGGNDPFANPDWRAELHVPGSKVAEGAATYRRTRRKKR